MAKVKRVCEKKSHERIFWAFAGLFLAGCATALGWAGEGEVGLPLGLVGSLCVGVYVGVIKLDNPRRKAAGENPSKVITGSVEPTPQDPKP